MSRYTPIRDEDAYRRGIDVGGDDYVVSHAPASARKYTTIDRSATPTQPPTATLRKASQGATPTHSRQTRDYNAGRQTVEVTKTRGNDVLYGSNFTRPRHTTGPRSTDGDTQVRHPRHGITRRGFIVWGVALAASIMATKLGMNTVSDILQAIQQGQRPATGTELVCGHGDSAEHPTELEVYVQSQHLYLIELPGGDPNKAKISPTQKIVSSVHIDKWHVEIQPQQVDGGRYQIMLSLAIPGENVTRQWLFVDSGHGYFRPVTK